MKALYWSRVLFLCLVIALLGVVTSTPARAYIDPGAGSYVLQVAAAGVLAAAFVVRSAWKNIWRTLGKIAGRRIDDAD